MLIDNAASVRFPRGNHKLKSLSDMIRASRAFRQDRLAKRGTTPARGHRGGPELKLPSAAFPSACEGAVHRS